MIIAGTKIEKGQCKTIKLSIAKLISGTEIDVPIVVYRGKTDGPVLMLMAGLHGDEINSIDVVRKIIDQKINHVESGTVICIPILNVFGFINFSREVPDGKDVNRSFPGSLKGSLASQIAFHLTDKVLSHCDYIIDYHTGGKSRYNIPQIRTTIDIQSCKQLAEAFNAPFTLHSGLIKKSLRESAINQGKTIIVFEGGESLRFNKNATDVAIKGTKNILNFLKMKSYNETQLESKLYLKKKWIRAPIAGFFHPTILAGEKVKIKQDLGSICGPFADFKETCLSPKSGHVISLNRNPMVNRGDAIIQIAY